MPYPNPYPATLPHPYLVPQLRSAGAQALQEQLGAVTCVGSLDLSDNGEWGVFSSWGPGGDGACSVGEKP